MTESQSEPMAEIIRGMRAYGFIVERVAGSDDYTVRPTSGDVFAYEPVLTLPPVLLSEYLEQMSRDINNAPDPLAEALSITTVHLAEDLDTDHHEGRNYTRSVRLRRRQDGRLALVVEKDIPDVPYRAPDPDLEWGP